MKTDSVQRDAHTCPICSMKNSPSTLTTTSPILLPKTSNLSCVKLDLSLILTSHLWHWTSPLPYPTPARVVGHRNHIFLTKSRLLFRSFYLVLRQSQFWLSPYSLGASTLFTGSHKSSRRQYNRRCMYHRAKPPLVHAFPTFLGTSLVVGGYS